MGERMIISESKEYDVILKVSKDYKGHNVYMVVYGLQVKTFTGYSGFNDAFEEYNNCLGHAVACEGILGEPI